ncbi:hypothetical protein KAR91_10510 [Candidatus Pacearchaeota archaeon]|nr:hypothetical protein [Candidatus Pacearchaeota archaeon]
MKIKFLKDQSWSIRGKIVSFKEESVEDILDSSIAKDMIRLGYGIEVVATPTAATSVEAKVIEDYDNKAMNSSMTQKKSKRKSKK